MRRDFNKHHFNDKRLLFAKKGPRRGRKFIIFLIFIAVLSGAGFYLYKNKTLHSPVLTVYVEQIQTWIADHKNIFKKPAPAENTKKSPELAAKNPPEPQVHFEFYTALPNMQVKVSTPSEKEAAKSNQNNHSVVNTPKATESVQLVQDDIIPTDNNINTKVDIKETKPVLADKTVRETKPFVDPQKLEQEFSKEFSETAYVIQLGIFKNAAAAERFKATLEKTGVSSDVVHLGSAEQNLFRVETGVFPDMRTAQNAKKQLQNKGVNGIVRKAGLS